MNKNEFYQIIKIVREKKKRGGVITSIAAVIGIGTFWGLIKFIYPIDGNPLILGFSLAFLLIPALIAAGTIDNQAKNNKLICSLCGFVYKVDSDLVDLGFTNQCVKCGEKTYET